MAKAFGAYTGKALTANRPKEEGGGGLIYFPLQHVISLRAKRVGEFIKNGLKKFHPPGSEYVVTLWTVNGLITLPPCIRLGQIFFASIWAKSLL